MPDGQRIIVGEQNSPHLVLNDQLEVIGEIGTGREPVLIVQGCDFHNGCTPGNAYIGLRAYAEHDEVRHALLWQNWDSTRVC